MTAEPLLSGQHVTYEQWSRGPETNKRVEVEDGAIVVNEPTHGHQRMVFMLGVALNALVPPGYHVVPSQDWVLRQTPPLIREPDLLVTRDDLPRDEHILSEPPLLAVEVLSPSTRTTDLVRKRQEYAVGGLDHYLVGDPDALALSYYQRREGILVQVREMSTEPLWLPEPFNGELMPGNLR